MLPFLIAVASIRLLCTVYRVLCIVYHCLLSTCATFPTWTKAYTPNQPSNTPYPTPHTHTHTPVHSQLLRRNLATGPVCSSMPSKYAIDLSGHSCTSTLLSARFLQNSCENHSAPLSRYVVKLIRKLE